MHQLLKVYPKTTKGEINWCSISFIMKRPIAYCKNLVTWNVKDSRRTVSPKSISLNAVMDNNEAIESLATSSVQSAKGHIHKRVRYSVDNLAPFSYTCSASNDAQGNNENSVISLCEVVMSKYYAMLYDYCYDVQIV